MRRARAMMSITKKNKRQSISGSFPFMPSGLLGLREVVHLTAY
jgi:hypothetical protein